MEKGSFYRKEIDGLRAIAIVAVMLFHAGIRGFGGGFVGVDIFFVISGYLITSIIFREIQADTFSLVKFWERRVRRIVPVMFVITLCVAVASYFIVLFPVDFIDFGQSLLAQSLFLANIFFMRKDSYFAGPSESMPLLHTWTLSVEEQFYIIFPLLLLLLWRLQKTAFAKTILMVLAFLFGLSFFYNIHLVLAHPQGSFSIPLFSYIWGAATNLNAGFFFLPARAWELILGAILAMNLLPIRSRVLAEILSCLGLSGIVYAIVSFGDTTPFPGFAALLPTIGCALIILATSNHATIVRQFLSFPALVAVGLISYSLYLWHWPLIVFSKIIFGAQAHNYMFAALALTFVLSWVTYTFVETPFRSKRICTKSAHMFLFGIGALAILAATGFMIHVHRGFPERGTEASRAIAAASVDSNPREYECFRRSYKDVFAQGEPCLLGDRSNKDNVSFVLWGDSHSDAIMPAVDALALEKGQTGAFFGLGRCEPILWVPERAKDERCIALKEHALRYIQEHHITRVLLVASWNKDPWSTAGEGELGVAGNKSPADAIGTEDKEAFSDAFLHTAEVLRENGASVYVMKKAPVFEEYDLRREFNTAARTGEAFRSPLVSLAEYGQTNKDENSVIDMLASKGLLKTIDASLKLCPEGTCSMVVDGVIAYKNGTHLNTKGAMLLKPLFEDFFSSTKNK